MSEYKEIIFDPTWYEHTALLAINRPHEYNSYTLTTLREMVDAIERSMWDDNIQFIVLTGVGNEAFCTGGNVHEYAEEYTRKSMDFWKWGEIYGRVFDMIMHCGKPVIARVNGAVAGGGFEFVCACDLAVASENARFISPGPRVGMTSVGGLSQWLPLHIGLKRAAEIVMLSTEIDAQTALEWGVVNAVVPLDELDNKVHQFIDRMLTLSPSSLWYFKVHLNWWRDLVWRLTWEQAKAWFSLNIGSAEPSEGLWAFKEKRKSRMKEIRDRIGEGMDPRYPFGPLMKQCTACGAEFLPEGSKFCLQCGAAL